MIHGFDEVVVDCDESPPMDEFLDALGSLGHEPVALLEELPLGRDEGVVVAQESLGVLSHFLEAVVHRRVEVRLCSRFGDARRSVVGG